MFKKQKSIDETKAIKILRKYHLIFLPGELIEEKKSLKALEGQFPSYDKEIICTKKNMLIFKYENVIDRNGEKVPCVIIMEYKGQSFIYMSHICRNRYMTALYN